MWRLPRERVRERERERPFSTVTRAGCRPAFVVVIVGICRHVAFAGARKLVRVSPRLARDELRFRELAHSRSVETRTARKYYVIFSARQRTSSRLCGTRGLVSRLASRRSAKIALLVSATVHISYISFSRYFA